MLLAQSQRPDDVSRTITWVLFVSVGTWYSTRSWSHVRGVRPLRNQALAGVCSATCISSLLWEFYLGVDAFWGSVDRLAASIPTLLRWTALGGLFGGLIGAYRTNRIYSLARTETGARLPP